MRAVRALVALTAATAVLVPAGSTAMPQPAPTPPVTQPPTQPPTTQPIPEPAPAANRVLRPPTVRGVLRYGRVLTATRPRFETRPASVRRQWLRDGEEIAGATGAAYAVTPADVGSRLRVRATARTPGLADAVATSPGRAPVAHRRDATRAVTYSIETRGLLTTGVREFAAQARATYADARGWRSSGTAFRQVARGGDFSLVLAAAEQVPRFSSGCSATYSCRVGRFVIINQTRWRQATPPWVAAGGSIRDYRHMVLNHETGHWLGMGHAGCVRRGAPAPVMMQQSKGLDGCRFNPWPTLGEAASRAVR